MTSVGQDWRSVQTRSLKDPLGWGEYVQGMGMSGWDGCVQEGAYPPPLDMDQTGWVATDT